jgi:acetate kinase
MNILVFNCGSSSLKYKLIAMPEERVLAGGEAQRVGPKTSEPARIVHRAGGREETVFAEMPDHASAFQEVMGLLARDAGNRPDAFGHRVVHGGGFFGDSAVIDDGAIGNLEKTGRLAPLHNPPAIALISACRRILPGVPQVAVFDTSYHSTIPWKARAYALPRWLVRELGLRKYGFHGTSHRFVASEAAKMLGKPLRDLNAVSCHLGSGGASLCAIVNGRSVDNTMGYSPLPGLMMSTRCGDLDPAVTLGMLARNNGSHGKVENILNKKSGVLGMSGISGDLRDIMAKLGRANGSNNDRLKLTVAVYLWRLRKALGAYLAVVGGADAVIFTDTIGELVPEVRRSVCEGMEVFGLGIDKARNSNPGPLPADVTGAGMPVRVLVIATNEELAIARSTAALLENIRSGEGVAQS